ncbi:hypothetical protein SGHV061 [Glossina pallidipes salivary gland hypertrophy virus]|uniref:Uncharacterized protein n=1 Tax=Glossina hytrovirus (isolate Glossina pallidipes/Ethiopia/Seibersdorf/-) TaxID=379529 RepID=B0YLL5_GHVS|nr:hypothetical protein SGHV061 [Glossina pallidipes salivary gland hypertrophy virus]ABQ08834.1 hypothetical protein SGHV061 [Glossina pallidipes salivary gland hypertrophy virus]
MPMDYKVYYYSTLYLIIISGVIMEWSEPFINFENVNLLKDIFFSFKLDEQSPQLYHLSDMTRCAAIYNYIISCGRKKSHLNTDDVFCEYINNINMKGNMNIMQIFTLKFEQFFAMFFRSRFGNMLKLAMMNINKVPVGFPVATFNHDGMVFMFYSQRQLEDYFQKLSSIYFLYFGSGLFFLENTKSITDRGGLIQNKDEIISSKKIDNIIMDMKFRMQENTVEALEQDVTNIVHKINQEINKKTSNKNDVDLLNSTNISRGHIINSPLIRDAKITNATIIGTTNRNDNVGINYNVTDNIIKSTHDPVISLSNDDLVNVQPKILYNHNIIKNFELIFNNSKNEHVHMDMISQEHYIYSKNKFLQTNFQDIWKPHNFHILMQLTVVSNFLNIALRAVVHSIITPSMTEQYLNDFKAPSHNPTAKKNVFCKFKSDVNSATKEMYEQLSKFILPKPSVSVRIQNCNDSRLIKQAVTAVISPSEQDIDKKKISLKNILF